LRPGSVIFFLLLCLTAALPGQQTSAPPAQFDVASIKPLLPPIRFLKWSLEPGARVDLSASLGQIIQTAYAVQPNQVLGLPKWAQSQDGLFHIVATTSQPASVDQLRAMLRALLADRFQLTVKSESRTVPGFALEVDKGGIKNLPAGQAGGRGINNQTIPAFVNILKPNDQGYMCDCGSQYLPVIDKTGLTGSYNLVAALGHSFLAPTNPPGPNYYHPDGMEPETIDELLHTAIGLRLVRTKVTETFLTIVRAEKPTPN